MGEPKDLVEALQSIGEPRELAGCKSKLHRAGEHLKTLQKEARTFRENRSYSVGGYTHPDTGTYILYATPKKVPPILSAIAGDVLCNVRPALDYLVFALAKLDSGNAQDGTQFPICDTPERFKRKASGFLKGLSPDHVAAIEALQPYPGRDGQIWLAWLRDLSNPDKHRDLHFMATDVGGDFELVKKPKRVRARVDPKASKPPPGKTLDLLKLGQGPKPKAKQNISISIPPDHKLAGADVYVHVGLRFDITFEEGLPVVPVLKVLHAQAAQLIKAFEPEFKRA